MGEVLKGFLTLLAPQSRHGDKPIGVKLGKTNGSWKWVKSAYDQNSIRVFKRGKNRQCLVDTKNHIYIYIFPLTRATMEVQDFFLFC